MLAAIFAGIAVLAPVRLGRDWGGRAMFRLGLFRVRTFTAGNIAVLLAAQGRGCWAPHRLV